MIDSYLAGSLPTLTWDDVTAIRREIPSVRFTSPVLHIGAQVQSDDRNWSTSVNGVSPGVWLRFVRTARRALRI